MLMLVLFYADALPSSFDYDYHIKSLFVEPIAICGKFQL